MNSMQVVLSIISLAVLSDCSVMYDLNLAPHECLETKAIAADYTPLGQMILIGNLTAYQYEAPHNMNPNRLLIGVYDIYGFNYENLKQVADQMAVQSSGFKVVLPDFFRGDAWDVDRNASERQEWMDRVGDWNGIVKPDLINVVQYYKNRGVEEFAIYGMCWGGKIATLAAIELSEYFKASGLVHPSLVTDDEAEIVQIPMYLMPSKDERNMTSFYQILQSKFGDNSGHRRFDDMSHGFTGARGNFSDPLIRERVDEVINKLGIFFDHNLNETRTSSDSVILQSHKFWFVTLFVAVFIHFGCKI
ncbi:putative AIM2 family protein C30D10.14 [Pseudolycoriella hygida]|uniref:AIM2 family protein C30D10.14 n=1 Tax=Pseudolycoriella hygida TaxID=35572 RepID=A0A9Q0MT95_9DIPT|nr:putative AIM2 family protein C30D10.14 [Pseudolycoriella hygida]